MTAFNQSELPAVDAPEGMNLTPALLWDNLRYFLERVVPVAEAAGVKLAIHPDDPPIPWMGSVPRILTNLESFQRLLDLAPHPIAVPGTAVGASAVEVEPDRVEGDAVAKAEDVEHSSQRVMGQWC